MGQRRPDGFRLSQSQASLDATGSDLQRTLAGPSMSVAGRALAVVGLLEFLAVLRHGIAPRRKNRGGKSLTSFGQREKCSGATQFDKSEKRQMLVG